MALPGCRFCLDNELLSDEPVARLTQFFILRAIDPDRAHQVMIIPYRHVETPFELTSEEWAEMGAALDAAKALLPGADGFTIGWNVGDVGGQTVFHAHMHVIARFGDEPLAGQGLYGLMRLGRSYLAAE